MSGTEKSKRGRPVGTPGGGNYNCKTKLVRVPVEDAPNIVKIIALKSSLESLLTDWDDRVKTAASQSKNSRPSPRYEQALILLQELKAILEN
jgi:hypothetical protein